jgi:hypothetical protein
MNANKLQTLRKLTFMKKPHTGFMKDLYNPYNTMAPLVLTLERYAESMTLGIIPGIRL